MIWTSRLIFPGHFATSGKRGPHASILRQTPHWPQRLILPDKFASGLCKSKNARFSQLIELDQTCSIPPIDIPDICDMPTWDVLSPYKFLYFVSLYVYWILGASLLRQQLPHCLVFLGHFATSGKMRPPRLDFEANTSLTSLPHFSGSLFTPIWVMEMSTSINWLMTRQMSDWFSNNTFNLFFVTNIVIRVYFRMNDRIKKNWTNYTG